MNANDVRMLVERSEPIDGFGDFIRDVVAERFIRSSGSMIRVYRSDIIRHLNNDIDAGRITRAFYGAGFVATYRCDDRPCAEPYFEVVLPPGNS
jgi:hypothetical protein